MIIYKKYIKNNIYITGNNFYHLLISSLKFANFILNNKQDVYYDNLYSNIYNNIDKITFITCGKNFNLFKNIISKFSFFIIKKEFNDDLISNKHFDFLLKNDVLKKKNVFIFLFVENFDCVFKSRIISYLDKELQNNYFIFVNKETINNCRLYSRCLNFNFFLEEEKPNFYKSNYEKEITNFINSKNKKFIPILSKKHNFLTLLRYLDKFIKKEIIISKGKKKNFFKALEVVYFYYNKSNFFSFDTKEKEIFLTEIYFVLNE